MHSPLTFHSYLKLQHHPNSPKCTMKYQIVASLPAAFPNDYRLHSQMKESIVFSLISLT